MTAHTASPVSRLRGRAQREPASPTPASGMFVVQHNLPFDAADSSTYPSAFSVVLGDINVRARVRSANGYLQDKCQLSPQLTLNLGVRYDWQDRADTKDANRIVRRSTCLRRDQCLTR